MIERVEALLNFFEPKEVPFLMKVVREVEKLRIDLPVLYAGSGGDVEHGIILGNEIIFVDSHLPDITLSEIKKKIIEIGCKILREKTVGKLGRGGKYIINFEFFGRIRITYFAEDIMKILKELKSGLSVYFVKVPHPKEPNVSDLKSPEVLSKALSLIVLNGFYLERECPLPNPELIGFEKVASGYISALSIHNDKGNLYRRVKRLSEEEIMFYLSNVQYK